MYFLERLIKPGLVSVKLLGVDASSTKAVALHPKNPAVGEKQVGSLIRSNWHRDHPIYFYFFGYFSCS